MRKLIGFCVIKRRLCTEENVVAVGNKIIYFG